MLLMVTPAYFPAAAGRADRDEETGRTPQSSEESSPMTPSGTAGRESQILLLQTPVYNPRVDEELGPGISPLPPTYSQTAPPRHSVVASSPLSPLPRDDQLLRIDTTDLDPPGQLEEEPLPRYSRYPKSELDATAGTYRDDSNSTRETKKICGLHLRTVVTGVIILITACVIAGGIVGYQIKNNNLLSWGDDSSDSLNSPTSTTSSVNSNGDFTITLGLADDEPKIPNTSDLDPSPTTPISISSQEDKVEPEKVEPDVSTTMSTYEDEPIPEPAGNDIGTFGYPEHISAETKRSSSWSPRGRSRR